MRKKISKWSKWILIIGIALVIGVFAIDKWVDHKTQKMVYNDVAAVPYNRVGLLLGTSKYGANGNTNWFYKYRIDATIQLFNAGKIDYVLISGDNGTHSYNEPEMMRDDLLAAGIPADRLYLDYAGFRTLDSIVRAKEVFGCTTFTIISQQFHNERALYIAQNKDIDAIAYNAKDVNSKGAIKVLLREKLARVKMLLDLTFNKQPKFFGPKIEIQ